MNKETGGAAFPHGQLRDEYNGMTLRDYFAAKAMQAIVSTVPHLKTINPKDAATESYEFADAMLEARK